MTLSELDPATFRLVTPCLNQLRYRLLPPKQVVHVRTTALEIARDRKDSIPETCLMTSLILKFQNPNWVQMSQCGAVAFLNILIVSSSNLDRQICVRESNGKVVPLRNHLSTTYLCMVEWRYKYTILGLGARWRWMVSFTPLPLYSREKSSLYPFVLPELGLQHKFLLPANKFRNVTLKQDAILSPHTFP
jgi:hypothetical protein